MQFLDFFTFFSKIEKNCQWQIYLSKTVGLILLFFFMCCGGGGERIEQDDPHFLCWAYFTSIEDAERFLLLFSPTIQRIGDILSVTIGIHWNGQIVPLTFNAISVFASLIPRSHSPIELFVISGSDDTSYRELEQSIKRSQNSENSIVLFFDPSEAPDDETQRQSIDKYAESVGSDARNYLLKFFRIKESRDIDDLKNVFEEIVSVYSPKYFERVVRYH